ncbi:DUF2171 domain-containing protein [Gluconacetobacter johannae]|nr:DUF2171 domain-containing protein [Gluconacetobacter johannae]
MTSTTRNTPDQRRNRACDAALDRVWSIGVNPMVDLTRIKEHADVIGADGVHVGTVDHVERHRIRLAKTDAADGKYHYISIGLIAGVEGDTVRLSANGDVAVTFEE